MAYKITIGRADKRKAIAFELSDFGVIKKDVRATTLEKEQAEKILLKELGSNLLTAPGFRNDQAVNLCIALHVLGIHDVELWLSLFLDEYSDMFHTADILEFNQHAYRVSLYVDDWGPKGQEYRALDFLL